MQKCFIPRQQFYENVSYPGAKCRKMFHTPARNVEKCFIPRHEFFRAGARSNNEQPLTLLQPNKGRWGFIFAL